MSPLQQRFAGLATQQLAAAGRAPTMPMEFRSQAGEDVAVWNILGRPIDGFYIEVGAFDGKAFAVTYALDCLGWKGLLVEAIPERYAQCVANRPNARVVHAALGPPGQAKTTKLTITDDQTGGMLSHVGAGAVRPTDMVTSKRQVEVPFTTMDELLKGYKGEIDLAVIDVEGFEIPLLQGFNLKKHRPRLLLIEDVEPDDEKGRTRITKYMHAQGYKLNADVTNNRVFARSDLAAEFATRFNGVGWPRPNRRI